jgi:sulfite exporter TauE/SafE
VTALYLAVLATSFLGSLHCLGMCGGFVALCAAPCSAGREPSRAIHLAYHGGRLATYVGLGAIAGAAGGLIDGVGELAGLQRSAALGAGLVMLAWGGVGLLRAAGLLRGGSTGFAGAQRAAAGALGWAGRLPPFSRALLTGLLTPLLPCGWLWLFVVSAAGTGGALAGGGLMLAFWAGTVPGLLALGLGLHGVARRLRPHLPLIGSLALLVVGGLTVAQRGLPTPPVMAAVVTPAELDQPTDLVPRTPAPCCDAPAE